MVKKTQNKKTVLICWSGKTHFDRSVYRSAKNLRSDRAGSSSCRYQLQHCWKPQLTDFCCAIFIAHDLYRFIALVNFMAASSHRSVSRLHFSDWSILWSLHPIPQFYGPFVPLIPTITMAESDWSILTTPLLHYQTSGSL